MANWTKSFQGGFANLSKNVQAGVQNIDLSGASGLVTVKLIYNSLGTIAKNCQLEAIQYFIKEQAGLDTSHFRGALILDPKTGRVQGDDLTELPPEYLALEGRVDALRLAHQNFLKITRAYEAETYDYPTQVNETLTEFSQNIGHSVSFWANTATKGTNLPQIGVMEKAAEQHKTMSHALSRAAANSAVQITGGSQSERLAKSLQEYAVAQDQVGSARLQQDATIARDFNAPWSATLNSQINAAMKARANVKSARLTLDAARSRAKTLTGAKAEQGRLEVEAAEEGLVNATEEAITLMRNVLDSPTPVGGLAALAKAQQAYHAQAAQILASIQANLDESATTAEADYRKSRI